MSISRIDIYTVTAAVVMSAVYDYEPNPQNDHVVLTLDNYHRASVAGIALKKILLLKALPFLYVPVVESIDSAQSIRKSTVHTGVASWFVDQK